MIITDLDILRQAAEPLKFLSEEGVQQEEGKEIVDTILAAMQDNPDLLAISAPQLGINKRIFCIRFDDAIKTFIDPIITKKSTYKIAPETFPSMPGKEILITRPEEITVIYYTADFKYEENKLLGAAARLFDQQAQLLDGILPDDLGLVSDVATDGSLAELSEAEIDELVEFYKTYVQVKANALKQKIEADPELEKVYKHLNFSEKVINGMAAVVANDGQEIKKNAQVKATLKIKKIVEEEKKINNAKFDKFLSRKGKSKKK